MRRLFRVRGVYANLDEETGQLATTPCDIEQPHCGVLRGEATAQLGSENRVAEPAADVGISVIVGGLIVSVMIALLSASQIVAP